MRLPAKKLTWLKNCIFFEFERLDFFCELKPLQNHINLILKQNGKQWNFLYYNIEWNEKHTYLPKILYEPQSQ
jgi:hypothetical protein